MRRRWTSLVAVAFLALAGSQARAAAVTDICWFEIDVIHCEPDPVVTEDDAWSALYQQDPDLAVDAMANPERFPGRSSCFQVYVQNILSCYQDYFYDEVMKRGCYLDAAVDLTGCVRRTVIGR